MIVEMNCNEICVLIIRKIDTILRPVLQMLKEYVF